MVVGTPASSMDLELFSTNDEFLQKLDDNDALLGSYPVDDNCRIHVCTVDVGWWDSFSIGPLCVFVTIGCGCGDAALVWSAMNA